MNSYLTGLIYSSVFLLILLFLEYITRRNNFDKELTRRIAHILSGLFGAIMGSILEPPVFITFVLVFLVIISLSYGVKFFSSIHNVKRKTYGEIFLPLGILIAYLLANGSMTNYLASVLILAISDPLAGIIGDISNKKLTYGSVVFFVSTLSVLLVIFKFEQFVFVVSIALIVTLVERISSYGTDNLTIPLASSLLLKLML
ncbi:hypothetical protein A2865_02545 [Candidatus Woesebacteria bacterium RIFCSPHIGHO2_01_FULL_39_17]|uniref:Phosphatidate cytidylyltransferase n=3 Tax=Candidatus Woeseibacteriota TaxID=1752722 RepID=A0A0G0NCL6_9BACT|nr:MAG: Phosphatidate cytidylyltransferase [Microgenomates group bacterium GW2011_GWC1_38_12]KKQ94512.1 MAG: Phosphatidate cytidylyltransferase [Candidatus Woesebacteria bacterium GW2011_GWB1_39_10b]KKR13909.1 MAG: Phosphatidate cytidylyltransferase [Candidatus Woesebacteria bacterium GW2011_GWA1_39_21b]OGM22471.1 MAG: hypothetical protein A2865_02545 [Candidatus Woesebacteria bacterium RIFCSPHIGHO2_01_FULL_39_17]OGM65547.1 MAG: hypothetical protein A3A52_01560 [Candidatus Woesebacteria bacteri